MLSVTLDEALAQRFLNIARNGGKTANYHIKKALSEYIEDREDSERALQALREDDGERTSLDAMLKMYDLKTGKKKTGRRKK